MKKDYFIYKLFCFGLTTTCVFGQELSVFEAGNIKVQHPYGLTNGEKLAVDNNKKIENLTKIIESLGIRLDAATLKYDSLNQKMEGMGTLFDSESQTINTTKKSLDLISDKIQDDILNLEAKIKEDQKKIDTLSQKLDKFIALQQQNNKLIEDSNLKMASLLNAINEQYVNKKQFEELVEFVNKNSDAKDNSVNDQATATKNTKQNILSEKPSDKTNSQLKEKYEQALKLFKANQITNALPLFEELVGYKYNLSLTNYYLGESLFIKKRYEEAIQNYKKSMIADDQADHVPNLLLHSAIAFENIKEKENAINFYKTIVDVYPDSKEAKEAKKRLKTIKKG